MRTLIRTLTLTLTSTLLCLAGTGCSKEAKQARAAARADAYFQAGDYEKAEVEYINVISSDSLNPHALGRIGVIYFDQGRPVRAAALLNKANELKTADNDVMLRYGTFQLGVGNFAAARTAANTILDRAPQDAEAPLLLAATASQAKDMDDVQKRLQGLPGDAANGAPVLVALGSLQFKQRNFKEAEALYLKAQTIDPKSSSAAAGLGALYQVQNDPAKAEKSLQSASEFAPARSPRRLQYAQYKILSGDTATALKELGEITKKTPDFLTAWLLQAQIDANLKKYDESAAIVAKVLQRDSSLPEAILFSARLKLVRGDVNGSITELEKAVKLYPQSPQVLYALAQSYAANGETEKAMAFVTKVISISPNFSDAVVLQAGINLRKGDVTGAIASLKSLIQKNPDDIQSRLLLAQAYYAQGNYGDALATYTELEKSFPSNPQPTLLKGMVYSQMKKTEEARSAFQKSLEISPDLLATREQLLDLELSAKNFDAAQKLADDYLAKNPGRPEAHILLAKVQFAKSEYDRTEATLLKAIALKPEGTTAFYMLASLYLKTGKTDKAIVNIQDAVAKSPKDENARMILGVMEEQKNDFASARDAYEKLLTINPKYGAALNNLAVIYSERFNQADKALELAQKARDALPGEAHTADTLGWILYKNGQYAKALPLIEESVAALPNEAEVQYHLGVAHYFLGNEVAARMALEKSLQLKPDLPAKDEVSQRLAMLAIDPQKGGASARTTLEKTISDKKNDPIALDKLAAAYQSNGETEKAVKSYESLQKSYPAFAPAEVSYYLGMAQYQAKQTAAAKLSLQKAIDLNLKADLAAEARKTLAEIK